jgi:hypothetical protein
MRFPPKHQRSPGEAPDPQADKCPLRGSLTPRHATYADRKGVHPLNGRHSHRGLPPASSWCALAGHRRGRLTAKRQAAARPRLAPWRRCPGHGGRRPRGSAPPPHDRRCRHPPGRQPGRHHPQVGRTPPTTGHRPARRIAATGTAQASAPLRQATKPPPASPEGHRRHTLQGRNRRGPRHPAQQRSSGLVDRASRPGGT